MKTANQSNEQSNSKQVDLPACFTFHEDAGHGWLAVSYRLLKELDIAGKITGYSYRNGDMTYLEEDQDAVTFIKAYLLYTGFAADDFKEFNQRMVSVHDGDHSFIRNLPHYY